MLKFAVAGVVMMLGLAATHAPAAAAPRDEDCTDCPASKTYDSEEVIEKIRNIKHSLPNEAPIDVPAGRRSTEPRRHAETRRSHESYSGASPRHGECADCAPRRKYDSEEVVKNVRDVDHSRVINTRVVVPYRTRVRETNHLVIHKNIIRNVGVVRHNRIIVEKEIRYVRRVPVRTRVEFITHKYDAVERPDTVLVPVRPIYIGKCSNRGGLLGTYGACTALRVRG